MNKKILILEELKRYAIDTANRIRKLSTEKVDKQDGKGLSSNDFTTSEKEKLKDISVATEDKPGLVKPDGDTITMDMDGTLHGTTIDELFSLTSTNPVQNKVVKAKFDEIEEKVNANESTILSHTEALNTLSGEGEGSVKKTAKDTAIAEITKVIADAPESFDTLKEISDWISNHESDASAMNSAIQTNKTDIASLKTDKVDKETGKSLLADTDKANYDDAVSKAHTHDNKSVLDGITSDKVTAWDNKSDFSGNYNDLSDKPTIPKGDGTTITMDEDGTLHGQSVDIATTETPGIVKPDGDTIEVSTDATISVSSKTLAFSDHDTATSGTSFTDAEDGNMIVTDWTKNLVDSSTSTITEGTYLYNGITYNRSSDGIVTLVSGTSSEEWNSFYNVCHVKLKKGVSYKLLGIPSTGGWNKYGMFFQELGIYDVGEGCVVTPEKDIETDINIVVWGGFTVNNVIIKPMITTDLSATYDDFVPYGGYEIKSCGKNLLNVKSISANDLYDCISVTIENGSTFILNGKYELNDIKDIYFDMSSGTISLKKNKKYIFSADGIVDNIYLLFRKVGTYRTYVDLYMQKTKYIITPNENLLLYFNINIIGQIDVNNLRINVQIEEVSLDTTEPTAYEPYTCETITVTNNTESPAFGLKSHKGLTHIISPGNVKCVYPTNESGKCVLDSLYNKDKMLTEQNKSLEVLGKCKNLFNPTLQTTVQNGVTCTNNRDGTYTLNGTAISDAYFYFISNSNNEKYKNLKNVKACGRNDDQNCEMYIIDSNGTYYGIGNNGAIINRDIDSFFVKIFKGTTLSNVLIKPMITTNLNATYDDFVPYTGEGETLTHDVAEIKNDLDNLECGELLDDSNGKASVTWSKHKTTPKSVFGIATAESNAVFVTVSNLTSSGCDFLLWKADGTRAPGISVKWTAVW